VDEQLVPFATLRASKGADEPSAFPVKPEFLTKNTRFLANVNDIIFLVNFFSVCHFEIVSS
jgi:hypothetical protein